MPLTLKVLREKDYSENPETLGQHLKKRRKELGLLQREVAKQMGIAVETLINWEKGRTVPVPAQFKPVRTFLGYDPTPAPETLAARVQAQRRALGVTLDQLAQHLGWDVGTLTSYLNGTCARRPEGFARSISHSSAVGIGKATSECAATGKWGWLDMLVCVTKRPELARFRKRSRSSNGEPFQHVFRLPTSPLTSAQDRPFLRHKTDRAIVWLGHSVGCLSASRIAPRPG